MPKMKTHKGCKKRFKVSANGKVGHKRCGSSHLMSHKNGKQVRRLRKKTFLQVRADGQRIRHALRLRELQSVPPDDLGEEVQVVEIEAAETNDAPPTP